MYVNLIGFERTWLENVHEGVIRVSDIYIVILIESSSKGGKVKREKKTMTKKEKVVSVERLSEQSGSRSESIPNSKDITLSQWEKQAPKIIDAMREIEQEIKKIHYNLNRSS